ncbi:MAG: NRAMP family divalent metal transporter [Thermoplasmata archaeon]
MDQISFLYKFKRFLHIIGPAWIVMIADIDVGSIITGIQSGAQYGYSLIFINIMLVIPLFIVQDASGRLGIVTKKGIGELIRENYGSKIAILSSFPMAITDIISYMVEYAGMGIGLMVLGLPVIEFLLIIFLLHMMVIVTRSYNVAEKILMPLSVLLLLFIIIVGIISKPNFKSLIFIGFNPFNLTGNGNYDYLMLANIGAVLMPFMLFFQSGAVAEKGTRIEDIKHERMETFIGAIVSQLMMIALIVVGTNFDSTQFTKEAIIKAMSGIGVVAVYIFGIALIIAGFFALIVISLGSAWGIVESLGIKRFSKPMLLIYAIESVPSLVYIFLFSTSVTFVINLMILLVFTLVVPTICIGLLIGNKKIMGKHAYKKWELSLYWAMIAIVEISGLFVIFL